jgi:hypothetical protein
VHAPESDARERPRGEMESTREAFHHMRIAPRMMVPDVRTIGGSRLARRFPAAGYDRARESILRVLDAPTAADLRRRMPYADRDPLPAGEVPIERLSGRINRHFDSHAAHIESAPRRSAGETGFPHREEEAWGHASNSGNAGCSPSAW